MKTNHYHYIKIDVNNDHNNNNDNNYNNYNSIEVTLNN